MKEHILIVEDDRTHRAITSEIISELGYKVTAVDNAFAALAKITTNPYDYALVFMDWEMPEMDGLEAVRSIRAHQVEENWPHIPVIAFTANKNPGDRESCMAAGMDDYLPKDIFMPKWRTELSEKLTQWLKVDSDQ